MASNSSRTIKYALLFVNACVFVTGLVMLISGSIVQHKINTENLSRTIGGYATSSGSIICIVVGILVLGLGSLGIVASLRDDFKFMLVFGAGMTLICLLQLIAGVVGLSIKNSANFNQYVANVFDKEFKTNSTQKAERDQLQRLFMCCGWQSYHDYGVRSNYKELIPYSCCRHPSKEIKTKAFDKITKKVVYTLKQEAGKCDVANVTQIFTAGCNMKLTDATRTVIASSCTILVIFSLFSALSVVLTVLLAKNLRTSQGYVPE
jgi:hypothetical protein